MIMKWLLAAVPLSLATTTSFTDADLIPNYYGTIGETSTSWHDASLWQGETLPTASTEVWMNRDNTMAIVDGYANVNKLVVARKAKNVYLNITNDATMDIGSLLFMGQYVYDQGPALGFTTVLSGYLNVNSGEMSVGVAAEGKFIQGAGVTHVNGWCKFGRYNKPEVVGTAILEGGSMSCNNVAMNSYSSLVLNGGAIRVDGNYADNLQSKLDGGQIKTDLPGGIVRILFDGERTLVFAASTADKKLFYSYSGQDGSWFNPALWTGYAGPMEIPSINDEVWLNNADTSVIVKKDEVTTVSKLVIARNKPNIVMTVEEGGELYVGDPTVSHPILFIGQYDGSDGKLILEDGGKITVDGEFSVGVSGKGEFLMKGGEVKILRHRLSIGRYNKASTSGKVKIEGGTLRAPRITFSCSGCSIDLRGGTIILENNQVNTVNGFIANGRISSLGEITAEYDQSQGVTIITTTANADNWDVVGLLSFTEEDVGPILPQINRISGMTKFSHVPPYGVHPRIFFGPDEIPEIRARLLSGNPVAEEARKAWECCLTLLTKGRAVFNTLDSSIRNLPSGRGRIDNAGLYGATHTSYTQLIDGVTSNIASQSGTHWNVLAGIMAVEAMYCVVFEGVEGFEDVPLRASNLVKAATTWASWALQQSDFGPNNRDKGGGQHMAFLYDLAYNFMNDNQRSVIREAIATMLWPESQWKAHLVAPFALQSNWVTLNSFAPSMVMAIEGDIPAGTTIAGWDNNRLSNYFQEMMKSTYNFLTYGWYSSGDPYEGMGKNYNFANMYKAYASRGYNFFTHPHVQKYAFDFMPFQLVPYGHFANFYDGLGGTGLDDQTYGDHRSKSVDVFGFKHAFPEHPAVNFVYRQFMEDPYQRDGTWQTELSARLTKVIVRSTYENNLLSLLILAPEYDDGDFTVQKTAATNNKFTFAGLERGLIISNSAQDGDAIQWQFHARQDMGGHTAADRLNFLLFGLGRIWVRLPKGYIYDTQWWNCVLVDGKGVPITPLDGKKARQPARLASFQDSQEATFATGDATYAYNVEWYWSRRLPGDDYDRNGWGEPIRETWNDFRRSDNKIPYSFGDIDFYDYPHWWEGGYLERMVKGKTRFNDMKQVYRTSGLVRGAFPYIMVIDDLEKFTGGEATNYQWVAQLPEDLTLLPQSEYPENADPVRDAIFMEPSTTGDRRLLIRILNAEGSTPSGLFRFDEDVTYYQWGRDRVAKRFIIERLSQKPRFRVLLCPFRESDPVPKHTELQNGRVLAEWPGQVDTLVFEKREQEVGGETVEITGFQILRNNKSLIDTRGKMEPNPIRS